MQSCEEVVGGECKTIEREVRYSGNSSTGLREDNASYTMRRGVERREGAGLR